MPAPKIVMVPVADLRPFKDNAEVYGPPTANSAYKEMKQSMKQNGFFPYKPLLITLDKRVVDGITRWACAKACDIVEVPCVVMETDDEAEIGRAMLEGNVQRKKSQLVIAREQRYALEIESKLAKQRMARGGDEGPSKATDRVGATYKESGKTVERRQKVLRAIEEGAKGTQAEQKKAEQLTELLETKQTVKALEMIDGKKPQPKEDADDEAPAPKARRPARDVQDHASKMQSEGEQACHKAGVLAEVEMIEANCQRIFDFADAARRRLGAATNYAFGTVAAQALPLVRKCIKLLMLGGAACSMANAEQLEILAKIETILKREQTLPVAVKALGLVVESIQILQKPEVGRPTPQALDNLGKVDKILYRSLPEDVKRGTKRW
jgi:ParB-like chromosome segregation protein Spo0J